MSKPEIIKVYRETADTYCIIYPDETMRGGLFKHQIGTWINDWYYRDVPSAWKEDTE